MMFRSSLFQILCLSSCASVSAVDRQGGYDWGDLEFGRTAKKASAERQELSEAEAIFRELLDESDFAMSMSMSMSMPFVSDTSPSPTKTSTSSPTASPKTPSPTKMTTSSTTASPTSTATQVEISSTTVAPSGSPVEISNDSPSNCDVVQQSADVLIRLEVDTADGVNTFTDELIAALTDALSSSFDFCTPPASRRLAKRSLENSDSSAEFALSVMQDPGASCSPSTANSPIATQCFVAILTLTAFGTDAVQAAALVPVEVELILDNDVAFDDKLAKDGIVDVRLQESSGEAALNSNGVRSNSENSESARPAVVAILSVAAGTVLAAVFIRKVFKRGGAAGADGKYDSDTGSESGAVDDTA